MEETLILIKPDGVKRGIAGEIITRFEKKGYELKKAILVTLTKEQAKAHYAEHAEKSFFYELIDYITSGPVLAMVWCGENIVVTSRLMIGKDLPGSIRGDYANSPNENVIHGSDSIESAQREIKNIFL